MEKEEWTNLLFAFYDAERARESAEKLLELLNKLFSSADSTSQVVTLWRCFKEASEKGILHEDAIDWHKFYSKGSGLSKGSSHAWDIFSFMYENGYKDCLEVELTFDKAMALCASQSDVLEVIYDLIILGNGTNYCGIEAKGDAYFKFAKYFRKCLDRGTEMPKE